MAGMLNIHYAPGGRHRDAAGMQISLAFHHMDSQGEIRSLVPDNPAPSVGRALKRKLGAEKSHLKAAARDGHHALIQSCSRRAVEGVIYDLISKQLQVCLAVWFFASHQEGYCPWTTLLYIGTLGSCRSDAAFRRGPAGRLLWEAPCVACAGLKMELLAELCCLPVDTRSSSEA